MTFTRAEFIIETATFPLGTVAVVSGADIDAVTLLLQDSQTYIEGTTSNQVLVYNSRDTVPYPSRYFSPEEASDIVSPISDPAARLREFDVVAAAGDFVILVANEFDINDSDQNRRPVNLVVDTVLDLFDYKRVMGIPYSYHRYYGVTREIFPYISKIYHYDSSQDVVTFIKEQTPIRP